MVIRDETWVTITDEIQLGEDDQGLLKLGGLRPEHRWVSLWRGAEDKLRLTYDASRCTISTKQGKVPSRAAIPIRPSTLLHLPGQSLYVDDRFQIANYRIDTTNISQEIFVDKKPGSSMAKGDRRNRFPEKLIPTPSADVKKTQWPIAEWEHAPGGAVAELPLIEGEVIDAVTIESGSPPSWQGERSALKMWSFVIALWISLGLNLWFLGYSRGVTVNATQAGVTGVFSPEESYANTERALISTKEVVDQMVQAPHESLPAEFEPLFSFSEFQRKYTAFVDDESQQIQSTHRKHARVGESDSPNTIERSNEPLVNEEDTALMTIGLESDLLRARNLLDRGNTIWPRNENAIRILAAILDVEPGNVSALHMKERATTSVLTVARDSYEKGYADEAYAMVEKILAAFPDDVFANGLKKRWEFDARHR